MNLSNHCVLCDHQIIDFKTGTKCGLTNRSPKFNTRCSRIKLGDKCVDEIRKVNLLYSRKKREGQRVFIYLILALSIGVLVSYFAMSNIKILFDNNSVALTIPIMIIGSTLTIVFKQIDTLTTYVQELNTQRERKEELDVILSLYNRQHILEGIQ